MNDISNKLQSIINYSKLLKGDEKGEAQVFCDRLFQAFGHQGYKEAGAILEYRVKAGSKSTRFADLLWGNRVLIEMKKRGTKLEIHRTQSFDYWWNLRPESPEYVILCNFDEFIIYNFSKQDEPLDKIKLENLLERYNALNFLFQVPKKSLFQNNLIDVTQAAASKVSTIFKRLIERGEDKERSQRFILQIVFAMFAEDIKLLPYGFFTELLNDCKDKETAFDLLSNLFKQMSSPIPARAGRFKEIAYFNGGLFKIVDPVELNDGDLSLLKSATDENWRKVHPAILGTIFQESMGDDEQHSTGSHFTNEIDIYKVVYPTIILPWRKKIEKAKTLRELENLRKDILKFKVLDPACGSGNFLYIAYRELKRLEIDILNKIHQNFGMDVAAKIGVQTLLSPKQFFGIDNNYFAVELAKVTLMLAKELSIKEAQTLIDSKQLGLELQMEAALPLDNLDKNLIHGDSLFIDWPEVDVIIGNPPFQSKNKMQKEFGVEYVNKVRKTFPMIPGRADFCVYWFYKAHNHLKYGQCAGLVGTNSIRQNYSRIGSLDYIVKNDGTIFNAVSSQKWPGKAVVFVSIVCWTKGDYSDKRLIYVEDSNFKIHEFQVERISSSLSVKYDVSSAKVLQSNKEPKCVFQGQTHGYDGFLVSVEDAKKLIKAHKTNIEHLFPYLVGDELLGMPSPTPSRFSIDFSSINDLNGVVKYPDLFSILEKKVLPEIKKNADLEKSGEIKKNGREQHLSYWWKFWRRREDMIVAISKLSRYISCSRVSKRPIFEFISPKIRPNDALMVFAFDDDYSFGIIHSSFHILWYQEKCSSMKGDPRYTTESIWDTFPWPQNPTSKQVIEIAKIGKELRDQRSNIMRDNQTTLRNIYNSLEKPGKNVIRDIQNNLDDMVREAYGFFEEKDYLAQMLELNFALSARENEEEFVQKPGLPDFIKNKEKYITSDCIDFSIT